jgi:hypothetical protein
VRRFFFALTVLSLGCSSDDNQVSLPEATQTGRGVFACYVDGKPFIDTSGSPNGISFNCYYQYVDGEYYFGLQGQDQVDDLISIALTTQGLTITEGATFQLLSNGSGNATAVVGFNPEFGVQEFSLTNETYTGEMHITKFDTQNQIVAGTFQFNIQDPFTDEIVSITQGRFDAHFGL